MTSIIFFTIFIPILGLVLLNINLILAPHKPYKEKKTPFECGFHSFASQNRMQFSVPFYVFTFSYLVLDLELFFGFPIAVTISLNDALGIFTLVVFFIIVSLGFIFELGNNALSLDTKQIESSMNLKNFHYNMLNSTKLESIMYCLFLIGLILIFPPTLEVMYCEGTPELEFDYTKEEAEETLAKLERGLSSIQEETPKLPLLESTDAWPLLNDRDKSIVDSLCEKVANSESRYINPHDVDDDDTKSCLIPMHDDRGVYVLGGDIGKIYADPLIVDSLKDVNIEQFDSDADDTSETSSSSSSSPRTSVGPEDDSARVVDSDYDEDNPEDSDVD